MLYEVITHNKGGKVFLITSAVMGEGKSFISLNLASIFAENSKKTIVVSFDFKRPKICKYLGYDKPCKVGLCHYLTGQVSLGEVIKHTNITNLDSIPVGEVPANSSELLGMIDEITHRITSYNVCYTKLLRHGIYCIST